MRILQISLVTILSTVLHVDKITLGQNLMLFWKVPSHSRYLKDAVMEITDQQDCGSNIRRIEQLLSCGVFEIGNSHNVLQPSAFIELVICLHDLLNKTEKIVKRISFTDDVRTNEYVHDITDAVTAIRDACCHINSYKRLFDDQGNRGSFLVIYGKGNLVKIGDLELKSDYEDDVAFFFGKNRLYINRHIVRAFKEAKVLLTPVPSNFPF